VKVFQAMVMSWAQMQGRSRNTLVNDYIAVTA
jgi:hypothetical protein